MSIRTSSFNMAWATDYGYQSTLQGQQGPWRSYKEVQSRKQTILYLGHPIIVPNQVISKLASMFKGCI